MATIPNPYAQRKGRPALSTKTLWEDVLHNPMEETGSHVDDDDSSFILTRQLASATTSKRAALPSSSCLPGRAAVEVEAEAEATLNNVATFESDDNDQPDSKHQDDEHQSTTPTRDHEPSIQPESTRHTDSKNKRSYQDRDISVASASTSTATASASTSTSTPFWQRLLSQQLSFGSATIYTVSECSQLCEQMSRIEAMTGYHPSSTMSSTRSVRITGVVAHKHVHIEPVSTSTSTLSSCALMDDPSTDDANVLVSWILSEPGTFTLPLPAPWKDEAASASGTGRLGGRHGLRSSLTTTTTAPSSSSQKTRSILRSRRRVSFPKTPAATIATRPYTLIKSARSTLARLSSSSSSSKSVLRSNLKVPRLHLESTPDLDKETHDPGNAVSNPYNNNNNINNNSSNSSPKTPAGILRQSSLVTAGLRTSATELRNTTTSTPMATPVIDNKPPTNDQTTGSSDSLFVSTNRKRPGIINNGNQSAITATAMTTPLAKAPSPPPPCLLGSSVGRLQWFLQQHMIIATGTDRDTMSTNDLPNPQTHQQKQQQHNPDSNDSALVWIVAQAQHVPVTAMVGDLVMVIGELQTMSVRLNDATDEDTSVNIDNDGDVNNTKSKEMNDEAIGQKQVDDDPTLHESSAHRPHHHEVILRQLVRDCWQKEKQSASLNRSNKLYHHRQEEENHNQGNNKDGACEQSQSTKKSRIAFEQDASECHLTYLHARIVRIVPQGAHMGLYRQALIARRGLMQRLQQQQERHTTRR